MPYLSIKLPVCNRCNHVWLPELLDGEVPSKLINLRRIAGKRRVPKTCANCKSPFWDSRRKHKKHVITKPSKPRQTQTERQTALRAISGADIFNEVMKKVKPTS